MYLFNYIVICTVISYYPKVQCSVNMLYRSDEFLPHENCVYIPHVWTKLNLSGMEGFRWEDTLGVQ